MPAGNVGSSRRGKRSYKYLVFLGFFRLGSGFVCRLCAVYDVVNDLVGLRAGSLFLGLIKRLER